MFLIKILILISMSFNYEYPRTKYCNAIIISEKENKILLIKG